LRDQILPRKLAWANDHPEDAGVQLNRAADAGFLTTYSVENPRQPQHPVAAVRLNRDNALVQKIIGSPISVSVDEISYEPLSKERKA
jgi:hypothetical protein